jgi:hypothetical protein
MSLLKTSLNDIARYRPENIKPEPNTIYLMARTVAPGADHLYYLYTNSKGEQFSLSGFPKNDRSKVPLATIENLANGKGGWGPIIAKSGPFSPNTPDYHTSTRIAVYRSPTNNPNEVARDWQLLKREYDKIVGAAISYRLNGYNSNSTAMTAERNWSNSTTIIRTNQGFDRRDVNVPGAQYDQMIEWSPNTQKSDIKDRQKFDSFLNQSNDIQIGNTQANITAFNALSEIRDQLKIGDDVKQINTTEANNPDLKKALKMLKEMKQDSSKPADKQNTAPEYVAVGSGKDSGMGR